MEKIGQRVRVEEATDHTLIRIPAYRERSKQWILVGWIVLWSLCGLLVLSALFGGGSARVKLIYVVFLAFWLYFEYMTITVARWRAFGEEVLRISSDRVAYAHRIGNSEKTQYYPLHELGKVSIVEKKEGSFSQEFEGSYYVKGLMRVTIQCGDDKILRMGEKLSDEDARNLAHRIDRELKKFREHSGTSSEKED